MIFIDMEMPKTCDDCPMFDYSGDYPTCGVTQSSRGYNFEFKKKRMSECPLHEIGEEQVKGFEGE